MSSQNGKMAAVRSRNKKCKTVQKIHLLSSLMKITSRMQFLLVRVQMSSSSCQSLTKEKDMDYYGGKWKRKRKRILRLDGYVCQIAKRYGVTEQANTVHHIYPAKEYPEYQWEDWNLISVSSASHNKLENRLTGELTEMGKELMRQTKPGVDWRKKR